jgi:hypothetical protein
MAMKPKIPTSAWTAIHDNFAWMSSQCVWWLPQEEPSKAMKSHFISNKNQKELVMML